MRQIDNDCVGSTDCKNYHWQESSIIQRKIVCPAFVVALRIRKPVSYPRVHSSSLDSGGADEDVGRDGSGSAGLASGPAGSDTGGPWLGPWLKRFHGKILCWTDSRRVRGMGA